MKKRILSLLFVSILSLSLMVGCGNNDTATNDNTNNSQTETPSNNQNNESENKTDAQSTDNSSEGTLEEQVQAKFEEAIKTIYNTDYTNESKAMEAEEYIKANFTPEGAKDMINKIISYDSIVSESDLLVTLVKEVKNTDDRFTSMYEVRYNITVVFDKPSIYSDLISVIFVDKDGKVLIESLNENNF